MLSNGIFHNLNSHRDNPLACLASSAQPLLGRPPYLTV